MSHNDIANAFVTHYYQTFDQNVVNLASLYKDQSMLTFEGGPIQGTQNIMNKLQSLGTIAHQPARMDVQPSLDSNNVVIFVVGQIKLDGQENPLHFSEFFQLVAMSPGNYYIHNQIFRLNYS